MSNKNDMTLVVPSAPDFIERYGENYDPKAGAGNVEIWLPVTKYRPELACARHGALRLRLVRERDLWYPEISEIFSPCGPDRSYMAFS